MATSTKKQRAKRRRGQQRQTGKNQAQNRYLILGVAVVVVALLGYFTFQAIMEHRQRWCRPIAAH